MKNILAKEKFICPKCNSTKSNSLISSTNFKYEYCSECNFNLNESKRQIELDFIFKKLSIHLKNNNNKQLNIELIKNSNYFELVVNGGTILNHTFTYELSSKDIYFIENTVFELVEDICSDFNTRSNIIICA